MIDLSLNASGSGLSSTLLMCSARPIWEPTRPILRKLSKYVGYEKRTEKTLGKRPLKDFFWARVILSKNHRAGLSLRVHRRNRILPLFYEQILSETLLTRDGPHSGRNFRRRSERLRSLLSLAHRLLSSNVVTLEENDQTHLWATKASFRQMKTLLSCFDRFLKFNFATPKLIWGREGPTFFAFARKLSIFKSFSPRKCLQFFLVSAPQIKNYFTTVNLLSFEFHNWHNSETQN